MNIELSTTFIATADHEAALGFYRDTLGLEVTKDVGYEGLRWITLVTASQPGIEVVLENAIADPNASAEDKAAAADLLAKGYLRAVIFRTDDVDALFEKVRASGAEVLQEPTDQFYGVRDCAFRDPSGNEVRFAQPKA